MPTISELKARVERYVRLPKSHLLTNNIATLLDDILDKTAEGPGGSLIYVALMSQSGTAAPVVTVFQNSIGTIVWTRADAGVYSGTLVAAFPAGKTFSLFSPGQIGIIHTQTGRLSNDSFIIAVQNVAGEPADDLLAQACLEIRIYP